MAMMFFGVLRPLDAEGKAQLDALLAAATGTPVAPTPAEPASAPSLPPGLAQSVGPTVRAAPGFVQALVTQTWPREAWEHAARIAFCESRYNPSAHNTSGEDSRGLWQINVDAGANADLLELGDLFDAQVNARAAYIVWQRQGWAAWRNCAISMQVPLSGPGVP